VVTYTITATNTGSLQLRNLAFTLPCTPQCSAASVTLTCNYGGSNTTATTPLTSGVTLELDQVVVCTGSYTFTQVCACGLLGMVVHGCTTPHCLPLNLMPCGILQHCRPFWH
jgi:hypothetical protein